MTTRTCACLSADARECIDLRYYGRAPILRGSRTGQHSEEAWLNVNPEDDDECACACHDADDDIACSMCGRSEFDCRCMEGL